MICGCKFLECLTDFKPVEFDGFRKQVQSYLVTVK